MTTVASITDGDTVQLVGIGTGPIRAGVRAKVRLLEVDSPERGVCFAAQATAFTRKVLPIGSRVWVASDRQLLDRYRRTLLYIWTPTGAMVNVLLVRAGMAKSMLIAPNNAHIAVIRREEAAAKAAKRGLWASCVTAPPAPNPAPAPIPAPLVAPPIYYANCTAARAAGVTPIRRGEAGYRPALDRDDDGIACE